MFTAGNRVRNTYVAPGSLMKEQNTKFQLEKAPLLSSAGCAILVVP